MNYSKYALIDLHLHIDGSLPINTVIQCAKIENVTLPSEDPLKLKKYLTVSKNCTDLNEYLKCFSLPISVMQSKKSLLLCAYELVKELNSQGLIYAELRFAPQFHTEKGLNQDEVTKAIMEGMKKAESEIIEESKNKEGIRTNLILCCMRGSKTEDNIETIKIAKKYYQKGVVAIDLAGAEAIFPTSDYENLFNKAKELGLSYTIHAGEADGTKSITSALDFGSLRLGHGIRSLESPNIIKREKEDNICLELCPTSNLQTKAVSSLKNYPISKFIKAGILCTINTDNMTVSGTTLKNEFKKLFESGLIDKNTAKQVVLNSAKAAFIDDSQKEILLKKIRARLND